MKQNRFRSKVFLAAVAAQVLSLGQLTGVWSKLGVDTGMVGNVIAGVLQLGVIAGILNDPTSADKF